MLCRIKGFKFLFSSHAIDAYLISNDINIKYLTDFLASESWLLITKKNNFYITDGR
ncbi:MAG: aminopeptidase P family N-terminal domain-containing protein, partial [Candidatus Omnitrophica bacterium]|nr:aminopeptidase P family N-terminal domain-containing protein [Candidatus Omnitrophota bacterium]